MWCWMLFLACHAMLLNLKLFFVFQKGMLVRQVQVFQMVLKLIPISHGSANARPVEGSSISTFNADHTWCCVCPAQLVCLQPCIQAQCHLGRPHTCPNCCCHECLVGDCQSQTFERQLRLMGCMHQCHSCTGQSSRCMSLVLHSLHIELLNDSGGLSTRDIMMYLQFDIRR